MATAKFILASASPRRKSLLEAVGADFEIFVSDADESVEEGLSPSEQVCRISKIKAGAAAGVYPDRVIVAADTLVSVDGRVLGKPKDRAEAHRMLATLSGRRHKVYTGVTVRSGELELTGFEETDVEFCQLTPDEIERYIDTGEPLDKAGAYGIQEKGALLIRRIDGDYFNVVGLPLRRLRSMLRGVGIELL